MFFSTTLHSFVFFTPKPNAKEFSAITLDYSRKIFIIPMELCIFAPKLEMIYFRFQANMCTYINQNNDGFQRETNDKTFLIAFIPQYKIHPINHLLDV